MEKESMPTIDEINSVFLELLIREAKERMSRKSILSGEPLKLPDKIRFLDLTPAREPLPLPPESDNGK